MSDTFTAFDGMALVSAGSLEAVTRAVHARQAVADRPILIFRDSDGLSLDLDLRGTADDAVARLAEHPLFRISDARVGPGRPKLGVVGREVSLLPRHWDWLNEQGNASAVLRRLVEEQMKHGEGERAAKRAKESAHRVMWGLAGDLPGFEDASRALFGGSLSDFAAQISAWPEAVASYLLRLAGRAAASEREEPEER